MSEKGGITKGKSHKEGGIPMVVKSTGQQVELEGGEGVINKRNMASDTKFEFQGKQMTTCEIASAINSANGNGVQIDCDDVTGKKYAYEDGGVVFIGYKEDEIMYEPIDGKYYANDKEFDSLEDAQKFLDSGGVNEDLRGAYERGLFEGGGGVKGYKSLIGKYVNIYPMGVSLPTEHQIKDVQVSGENFRYRYVTLKFDLGIAPILLDEATAFMNNEIIYVNNNKEEFGIQLMPNQFKEGGGVDEIKNGIVDFNNLSNIQKGDYIVETDSNFKDINLLKVLKVRDKELVFQNINKRTNLPHSFNINDLDDSYHFRTLNQKEKSYILGSPKILYLEEIIDKLYSIYSKSSNFENQSPESVLDTYIHKFDLPIIKRYQLFKNKEMVYDTLEDDFMKTPYGKKNYNYSEGGDVRDFSWYQDFKKQELKRGTEHEMEHIDTIREFKKKGVSDKEVAQAIAKDHLEEDENYYIELDKMESSRKLSEALKDFEKHTGYRKNAHKFRHGGYMGEAREVVHIVFNEDFDAVIRESNGKYVSESVFPKDSVFKFTFKHNDGRNTLLEFANTGAYISVPNEKINVVGFNEQKFGNGGNVKPYQSIPLNDHDKQIMKLLTKYEDPSLLNSSQKEKLSTFKGTNVVNELSSSLIQKIYGLLFDYHNVEHPIRQLFLSNVGVGNIVSYAPKYIDKLMIEFDEKNRFDSIEREINSIINANKKYTLFDNVEIRNMDAIIHVYPETNPPYEQLNYLLYQTEKPSIGLGICEFTSMERMNKFQQKVGINQGAFAQNQMMMYQESTKYLQISEGITDEGQYTLIYILHKMS